MPRRTPQSRHNSLSVIDNSLAMNGITPGIVYSAGFPVYKLILIILWVVVDLTVLGVGFRVYRTIPWSQEKWENRKRISKKGWIIIASATVVVVAALLVTYFFWLAPILQKAFTI